MSCGSPSARSSTTPAWLRADRKSLKLDFTTLPTAFVPTAKRLFYAQLTQDTPPGEQPITIASIRTYFSGVGHFLLWGDARGRPLAQMSGWELNDYHRELVGLRLCLTSTYRYRRAVRLLWAYRSHLPDHLGADPLRRPSWQAWARASRPLPPTCTPQFLPTSPTAAESGPTTSPPALHKTTSRVQAGNTRSAA
ncbi:hypothetical protein ACFV19_14910 [Streptomyces griseoluteus]|uniref:hypothetical protein n=1 Tax=Streptomyces griseoluteus TaxID=29306 RepID=UPI0036B1D7F5